MKNKPKTEKIPAKCSSQKTLERQIIIYTTVEPRDN
jgi:hypothetical protein